MFPRHVRWYRLLLLLLVIVNSDEAIAKTANNFNLDSGSGNFITCPGDSTSEFTNQNVVTLPSNSFSKGRTTQVALVLLENHNLTFKEEIRTIVISNIPVNSTIATTCTASATDATCGNDNGTATVNVTGGTPPYNYSWSNGETMQTITDLATGSYSVTTTDGTGCISECSVSVASIIPICNASATGTTCNEDNGTATANVTGGTPPYSYSWSTGETMQTITGLAAGSYEVTITDEIGCISDCSVSVPSNAPPSCTTSATDATCGNDNGTATVNVTGGSAPYSYSWSTGETMQTITGLAAGTYEVTITDEIGCNSDCSVTVASIIPTCTASQTGTTCNEENGTATVNVTGGTPPFSYEWSTGETMQTITSLAAGTYEVTITDENGCNSDCSITVEELLIDVDCSSVLDLFISCNTEFPPGQTLDDYIESELADCSNAILAASSACDDDGLTIESNFLFTGSGTSSYIIFTGSGTHPDIVYTGSGSSQDIIFTISDINGNQATCSKLVTLDYKTNDFSLVCNGSQCAYLEDNGTAYVVPENFVEELLNACDSFGPYTYEIARMVEGPCGTANDLVFENTKAFCCVEAGIDVTVFIRVTDSHGNSSSCMTTVEVKDLINPTITSCPINMTISCNTNIDLDDLSQFGTATGTDNCPIGFSIVASYEDLRENCGLGEIIRTFTFKDASNNTVSCSQTLMIINDDPLTESNIIWPPDNTYTNLCNDEIPTPAVSGSPSYPISSCISALVTHTDDIINFGPGCLIVNRTWVVIDWCQFDGSAPPNTYRWEHTQEITLENNIAPTFSCETYIELCGNEQTCTGMINYTITATDDCAESDDLIYIYTLTLEDGTVVNGHGNSINSPYPYGEHTLIWSVSDQCGNKSTCAQSIKIKDCKPPTAICLSGVNINLTQNPGMPAQVVIWASDIDASSSDNCTATSELEFAFDTNFTQSSLTFDCNDLGSVNMVLYVRDADGNIGICKSTIGIQDNHNLCDGFIGDPDEEVMIAGRVSTHADLLMENVDVMLENSNDPMHYMTDVSGQYAFENLPMYDNFRLVPTFEDEAINGISTADIVLIQRHILGLQKLDSPYKVIAADINNSENVSATDIIELRKIILGTQEKFNNSTVWRFVDSGYQFADPEFPFPYHQTMTLTQLDHDAPDMNFVGIKTGDVNYSALINGFIPEILSFRSPETLSLVSSSLERGSVQLTVNKEQELSGFQLAFRSSGSLEQFNLSSSLIQIDESNFAIDDDIVKISWSSAEAIIVKEGEVLFTLNFDGEIDFQLLNDLPMFNTEAYNASINPINIEINTETKLVNNEWQVFRNTPNPFVDNTFIPFTAPSQADLSLSVFDVNGKTLYRETRKVGAGYQKWEVTSADLGNVHGVLYYRLESKDFNTTQSFIRLK